MPDVNLSVTQVAAAAYQIGLSDPGGKLRTTSRLGSPFLIRSALLSKNNASRPFLRGGSSSSCRAQILTFW